MKPLFMFLACVVLLSCQSQKETVFQEVDGYVMIEAEDFMSQEKDEVRQWYIITPEDTLLSMEGFVENHCDDASGEVYLKILPDTRRTHGHKLIPGENFSNEPGKLAVLNYKVRFKNPGKYYVWARAYSSGPEDNGIHVGLNGEWPESGQRMQWCIGKHQWTWESKQRTKEVHCGVAEQIFLEIEEPGIHTISFSMREDGFEFDCFALSQQYKPSSLNLDR